MVAPATELDIRSTPIGFTESVLGMKLYDWQSDVLTTFERATGPDASQTLVALKTPNAAGKSSHVVAPLVLWILATFRRGKVVFTTKDTKQLNEQILPSLTSHKDKFEGWDWKVSPYIRISTPTGGTAIGFTTDEPERVEGHHKIDNITGPLVMIADETKGIDDKILQGIDRCSYNALLYCSTPGLMYGRFYDAFYKDRAQFKRFEITLQDCPHIEQAKIDRTIAIHGIDHPFTRSTIFGEFMSQEDLEQYLVDRTCLEFSAANPPAHRPGLRAMFCDFAGAGAENTIAYRDGNKIELVAAWREANKHASVSRFIQYFRHYDMQPNMITGDSADKEMCDLLSEAGWPIRRQNFGAEPRMSDVYVSWAAEAWCEAGIGISKNEWIIPRDEELFAQLTTRRRAGSRSGKIGIEDKYKMRKDRNLPSPDKADAVVGVMWQKEYAQPRYFRPIQELIAEQEAEESSKTLDLIGANAGWG